MTEKKNILVFPCGSEIGLALNDCLRYSKHFQVIGLSSVDDHGKYVFDQYVGDAPMIDDSNFVSYIKEIVRIHRIDAIYPTMDSVIVALKNIEGEIGCKVVGSSQETSKICGSKELTYELLSETLPCPVIYRRNEIDSFPIFTKPKVGYGSRGAKIINSQRELDAIADDGLNLFLEYLPGEECTVDCFTDRNGELLFSKARKRNRIKGGISVNTFYIADSEQILQYAQKINSKLKFNGAWFFQLKKDSSGKYKLLEIADRFGGSSILSKSLGVNIPQLELFNLFGYNVEIFPFEIESSLDRALKNVYKLKLDYSKIYVDFDDCIELNHEILNSELIGFLITALNSKKRIILLSKHDGDLIKRLKEHRILDLFDEIIHISKDKKKIDYIVPEGSIFIDDSFTERKDVYNKFHIPVFGPEMVDVL